MNDIIKVQNLFKTYKNVPAVNGISFNVKEGEIFGFLGPNGAGKSTTINIICTIIGRSEGSVLLDGLDVAQKQDEVRKRIGVVFQEKTLDERLTARENLMIHGYIYGLRKADIEKRIDEVLDIVELKERKNSIVASFSGGMKRRLEIARGFMHFPKVLFLDEPTTGLDPQTRTHIWEYIVSLKEKYHMTIFLTTHYMDEAEICDNIAIMDKGIIVANGTPLELKENLSSKIVRFETQEIDEVINFVKHRYGYNTEVSGNNQITIEIKNSATEFLTSLLKDTSFGIQKLHIEYPTLNDVFMNITGKKIRE